MFVMCDFTRQVWVKVLHWMQRQSPQNTNWDDHLQWVIDNSKGKSTQAQVFKMVYVETVYALWNERNQRVFEQKAMKPAQIVKRVAYICNFRAIPRVRPLIQAWLRK